MYQSASSFDRKRVERQQDPQRKRFHQLVIAHAAGLYRYALWLTQDTSVAEDLVQETLLRAWRAAHQIENPESARPWLITILRRENARRFERRRPEGCEVEPEEIGDQHRDYDTSTEAFVLRRALAHLPEGYREPLVLQVIEGYSQQEIATHLGISLAGAGTRLFRARQKLKSMLVED